MVNKTPIRRNKETTSPIVKLLNQMVANWYWVVLSTVIFFGLGYLYTKSISYQYSANALILIKDGGDMESQQLYSESTIFSDLGIGSGGNSVESEIVMLKSSQLMNEVVERLDLTTQYGVKPLLRYADIYDNSPIKVDFLVAPSGELEFVVAPISAQKFEYRLGDNSAISNFGDTISINNVKVIVKTTNFWGNGHSAEEIIVKYVDSDEYTQDLLGKLFVARTDRTTGAIALNIVDINRQRAEDILGTLIDVYRETVIDQKNKAAQNTERFIAERINMIYADLGDVDGKIEEFKKENKIVDFGSVTSTAYNYRSRYSDEIAKVDMQISLIDYIRNSIKEERGNYSLIAPNNAFVELGIAEQVNRYNTLVMRYEELRKNSGENNPVLIKLKIEIENSKENTEVAIDNLYANLKHQKSELIAQGRVVEQQISALPTKEKVVKDVMREQSIKEQLYLYLLNKREANALQLAITESNMTIVEPATASVVPTSPDIPLILLLSTIGGVLFPAFVISAYNLIDNKVYTKEDIENGCDVPIIGVLPKKQKSQIGQNIIVKSHSRDPLTEAFRVVRSNINYFVNDDRAENEARIIQFTSTISGEGKTFVSMNIAISFAQSNKRVLLMDIDLRRRGLSKVMCNNKLFMGITGYLMGMSDDIEEIIIKGVECDNLDFINVGALPPDANNLLTSKRFAELIKSVRGRYDYIIMDSAPYFAVADSQIINSLVDDTIWVMRSGRLNRTILSELDSLYEDHKVRNLSILLTDADLQNKSYGYGYGYGECEIDK